MPNNNYKIYKNLHTLTYQHNSNNLIVKFEHQFIYQVFIIFMVKIDINYYQDITHWFSAKWSNYEKTIKNKESNKLNIRNS